HTEQQPVLGLVLPEYPEHREHDKTHHGFAHLRWGKGYEGCGRHIGRKLHTEWTAHDASGGRRWTVGKLHRQRTTPRPTIIVANCPAPRATKRVTGRDGNSTHVANAPIAKLASECNDGAQHKRANQSAEECESAAA